MTSPLVFLSSVNAAYPMAREAWQFLRDREVTVFFCEEALLRTGDSFYRPTMERSLREATHLLVVLGHEDQAGNAAVQDALRGLVQAAESPVEPRTVLTLLAHGIRPSDLPLALQNGRIFEHPCQMEALYHAIISPEVDGALAAAALAEFDGLLPALEESRCRKRLSEGWAALLNLILIVLLGWMWLRQEQPAGEARAEQGIAEEIPLQKFNTPGARYTLKIHGSPQHFSCRGMLCLLSPK